MESLAIETLSNGEKEALRLYLETSDPKQIAVALGKSHHEIERRFKEARRKMGVNRTRDVARLLAIEEGNPTYQKAVYGDLVGGDGRKFGLIRPPSESGGIKRILPFPTKGRPWNALSIGARLAAILAGVFILAVSAVLFVSFAQTLTSIVRHRS